MAKQSDEKWMTPYLNDSKQGDEAPVTTALTALELNQIYTLVDSILPFEACLYYQVLPLYIEGSRLIMGTVNPDDPAAFEYVTKQLSYINYSLRFQEISSDWHRDLLSKYLSQAAKSNQSAAARSAKPSAATSGAAIAHLPPSEALPPTFILDQPDELPEWSSRAAAHPSAHTPHSSTVATVAASVDDDAVAEPVAEQPSTPPRSRTVSPQAQTPLELRVDTYYRDISNTLLSSLPPQPLMQALLGKVLDEGIGRLYFERRSNAGRILWSRDGVLQAVVDTIAPTVFQGVINEFKRLMHLSLIPVRQSQQVEIERTYQDQRILLRLRLMRGEHGEEATVQILRGAALRFYQQQQIDRLGRDALDAAQTLQQRLNEIRDRARNSLNFQPTRSQTLPALVKLLTELEAQVKEIEAAYDVDQPSDR